MLRHDGRQADEMRPVTMTTSISRYAEGSVLIEVGATRVLCTASIEKDLPHWLRGQGRGWVTGEYALLPRSTHTRSRRERNGASGRTQEIQRLIGRTLRAAVDLRQLGERLITIDCDVLQADGGTRTAAITGGYVALALALKQLQHDGSLNNSPLRCAVAAVSVGIVADELLLDLDYTEDSEADVDCNIAQTDSGGLIEVQGTSERTPMQREQLWMLLNMAEQGIATLFELQRAAIAQT
jgi:ribonuclease PH